MKSDKDVTKIKRVTFFFLRHSVVFKYVRILTYSILAYVKMFASMTLLDDANLNQLFNHKSVKHKIA